MAPQVLRSHKSPTGKYLGLAPTPMFSVSHIWFKCSGLMNVSSWGTYYPLAKKKDGAGDLKPTDTKVTDFSKRTTSTLSVKEFDDLADKLYNKKSDNTDGYEPIFIRPKVRACVRCMVAIEV